ncbi:MAG: hypothetical protein ACRDMZ_14555 [Solirubrobacteraceae bacterium]
MPNSTPISAPELSDHLRDLYLERAFAELRGLSEDEAYMADLRDEIATCRSALVGAAVTEIASLRGELGDRAQG